MHLHNANFDPEGWKPRVPNPAFIQARADDKFWAARKLAAMTADLIRAAVRAGQFDDPASEEFLVRALVERRDAITRTYLTALNPISNPALGTDGTLTFRNAAADADVAAAPRRYRAVWFRFDNATSTDTWLGESSDQTAVLRPPVPLPEAEGSFVKVELSAVNPDVRSWEQPVHAYFRLLRGSWRLVGFERMPEPATPES